MHSEDLFVNDRGNWQAVETIGEGLPQFDIVSSFAFVIKSVNAVDRGTLVIAPENEEIFRILNLVR